MSQVYWVRFSGSTEWHLAVERGDTFEFPGGDRETVESAGTYRLMFPEDLLVGPVKGPDSKMPGGLSVLQAHLETLAPIPQSINRVRSICCHEVYSLLGALIARAQELTARVTELERKNVDQESRYAVDLTTITMRVQALERHAGISPEVQPSQPWPRGSGDDGSR